jgi:prophage antirepressor-like protein
MPAFPNPSPYDMTKKDDIILYQGKDGAIELREDFHMETIWASLDQIASLFERDKSVISRHIKNIFTEGELAEKVVVAKNATTTPHGAMSGKTQTRQVVFYNLDMILSVGYRVNSKTATKFRQWATKTLKKHITEGYTINPTRIEKNYEEFLKAVEDVKKLLPSGTDFGASETLELIKLFAGTWFSLDAYDKSSLPKSGASKKQVEFTAEELIKGLTELKLDLISKKEATHLFAEEKQEGNLAGIVGNVFQSAFGQDAYSTLEEKAAHLLYFIIKNHPFNDGNKRSGAFAFVWFLRKAQLLDTSRLSPEALTTLALLIAESNPKEKERMVGLVLLLLR